MNSKLPGTDEKVLKERVRFEVLLSDISARLMAASNDQVDLEIERALRIMLDFFEVDLCAILDTNKERALARVAHAVYGEGIEPVPGEINLAEFYPWGYRKLMSGELINITRPSDYPEEALKDKESDEALGTLSKLAFPVDIGGGNKKIITIQQRHREQSWPEEYILRLRLLGEIMVNALERRRDRLRRDEQLGFEKLVSAISAGFINLPASRVDDEILAAERRICEYLKLDLAAIWQWSMEPPHIGVMTHIYRPIEGPPLPDPMYAHETFPWCQKELESGRMIFLRSIEDAPAEAARDKEMWLYVGVRSVLTIPLMHGGGPIIGALSFCAIQNECFWPEYLVKRLEMVAQVFTNALARKQADTVLRESEARLSMTTESVGAGLWIMDVCTNKIWVSPMGREMFHFGPDEEIFFERYFQVIHPDDRDLVHREVRRTIESGEVLNCDYRIVLPDGCIRWIAARGRLHLKPTGEPDRLMGLSLDITRSKGMELQLNESETLLSVLINSTDDMIWSVDAERFGLLTFNNGLSGYFLDQRGIRIKPGDRPEDLFSAEEYIQQWHTFYKRALEDGSFTTEYQTYSGHRTLRLSINRLTSEGRMFGASVFAQDITAIKQMERQLQERLQEIEKLKERLEIENVYLRQETQSLFGNSEIVGDSKAIKKVLSQAGQVAATGSTVLIQGETGTGKELVARAIHNMSKRKDRTLVTVNCASLPPNLIESELFGREKGAYTGALTRMVGRFETADGSTLFLDEIGEMPIEVQSKLLRVLEQGVFERLGSTRSVHVDVRIIAATNRDLSQAINEGKFRKDLYYRLNVFPINLPPLRDRSDDIVALVWAFVKQFETTIGKRIDSISKKGMEALVRYGWPGNVRELKNVIEHAMILNTGRTLEIPLPEVTDKMNAGTSSLEDMERRHILETLEKTNWRISGKNSASEILGMKRTTLQSKMKVLGISRPAVT